MKDLRAIPYDRNMKFASLDLTNMYSNVPTNELMTILKNICENNNIEKKTARDIMKITRVLIQQNYFQYQNTTYVQTEGLAMGAPTSSVFSEIFLQWLENTKIVDLLIKHEIEGYFRYVDDILVVYREDKTNIHNLLNELNNLIVKINFTLEEEENNKINFLDITINKDQEDLRFEIYRKPTATDTIIPNDSCHPGEHKAAAIRYFHNRLRTYGLTPRSRQKEENTVRQILNNNKYDASIWEKIKKQKRNKQDDQKEKKRWAKFTYVGKETKLITKLFKDTNIKVAFTTDNTIGKRLTTKQKTDQNMCDKNGVYQLTCPNCEKKYTGQTGRPFKVRFQEHLRDYKYGNNRSKFAQHLLENKHGIGPMKNIMHITHVTKKGKMLDTLEKFYIYRETEANNQINDKLTVQNNAVFKTIVYEDPYRGLRSLING